MAAFNETFSLLIKGQDSVGYIYNTFVMEECNKSYTVIYHVHVAYNHLKVITYVKVP